MIQQRILPGIPCCIIFYRIVTIEIINRKNTVLNAALKLIKKSSDSDTITPYEILYGYSRLITLDEDVLHEMFSEQEYKELIGARRFLSENKLDINLLRKGILYLIPYLEDRIIPDEEDSDEKVLSSYDILCELIDVDDSVIRVFKFGNSLEDVFSLQEKIQADRSKKKKAEAFSGRSRDRLFSGKEPSGEGTESGDEGKSAVPWAEEPRKKYFFGKSASLNTHLAGPYLEQ